MSGRKPFGITESERKVVDRIKLLARIRKGGRQPSLLSIARQLNTEGIKTKMGGVWTGQGVKNVLAADSGAARGSKGKVKKSSLATGDYLTKEQLGKVMAAARQISSEDGLIIAVLVGSGLRASELCALQVRDLGIEDGKSQIDVRRGKGAKQRSVFISRELAATLRGYLRGKQSPKKAHLFATWRGRNLTYDALYKRVKRIGQLAGLPDLHPHTFRHTFGTLLYHYKKDLFFVMEQLGHSKVDTTQIYAKTLTASKLEQMDALGNDLKGLLASSSVPDNASKPERVS